MKKMIRVCLALGMAVVFCGCGSTGAKNPSISDFYTDFYRPLPPGPLPFPVVQF